MSLKIIDNTVYTIGIPGKDIIPNASIKKRQTKVTKRVKNDSQISQQQHSEPMPIPLQPNTENNSNSMKPLLGLNSVAINIPKSDLQYQLNINPNTTTQTLPEFLQMNLQCSPFNLTSDETTKLISEYQSNNIRLIQKAPKKSTTTTQNNVQTTTNLNTSQINVQSQNVQPICINVSQPSNNQNVPIQSQIKNIQHQLGHSQLAVSKNSGTNLTTNVVVQQQPILNNRIGNNIVIQQQQLPQLQPMIRSRVNTTQLMQKSIPQQQEQHQQMLIGNVGSNMHIAGANVIQKPIFQQIRPNALLAAKMNVQQRQQKTKVKASMNIPQSFGENVSTKTNARLSDSNIQHMSKPGPSLSSTGVSNRSVVRPQKQHKLVTKPPSLEKMPPEDYARLRQAVMASLIQTNPEMFTRGQTVIGEITRSQSIDNTESNSETPQNENP